MFKKIHSYVRYSFLLAIGAFSGCSLFPIEFNTTPTKDKMDGVWVLSEAYDQAGVEYAKDINFPITAFDLGNTHSVMSTGGPMFMHIVYGANKYTNIASKVDKVFNYATLNLNDDGEWFIGDGDVDRFTIEMKLGGLPGQQSLVDLLSILKINASFLDVTIYHKFMDIKVTFTDMADSVMVWEFDSQTTAEYNTKDKYGKLVLWNGWPVDNFERGRFIFRKRSMNIKDIITAAKP